MDGADLQAATNELIAHRVRVGLAILFVGAVLVALAEAGQPGTLPPGILWTHLSAIPFTLVAILAFGTPAVRRRPVPWVLLLIGLALVLRVTFATARGDVITTVFMCVSLALAAGGTLPWGVGAQLITVLGCAATILANEWLVAGTIRLGSGREAIGIAVGLALSLALAFDRERHRRAADAETLARRRTEHALAELNVVLEQRVRQRTAELAAVIENSGNVIWSVDREGALRTINRAGRERFAVRYGAADPGDSDAPVPAEIRDAMYGLYARAFAGEHLQVERTFEWADGPRHYLVSAHPIVEDGQVTGAAMQSTDITELRRAEEQARQHQAELAHVLRVGTMGEMAAGLAHEINQPIGAMANYALGAARRLRDGTLASADLLPLFEAIGTEALRAGDIIRRIRTLLRKETPQLELVDANEVARAAVRVTATEARRHRAHIALQLAPALPPVHGNAIQLEQVLLNLLLNAFEASAGHGAARLVLRTAATATGVEVTLADDGPGLPAADVFAPFFTTKAHGLGMGLSISRSIVELHGGTLEGWSNPESRGSTFRVHLPGAPPRGAAAGHATRTGTAA